LHKTLPTPIPTLTLPLKGRESTRALAFTYPHAPVRALARAFENAVASLKVSLASTLQDSVPSWHPIAPVPQTEFDALLAQFELLLVRGEDSFIRAQYVAKPMLWHIYPTDDRAHIKKLDAWLDRYCASMTAPLSATYRRASLAFVDPDNERDLEAVFASFARALPELHEHALRWRDELFAAADLATRLLAFYAVKSAQKKSGNSAEVVAND
jgi:uncharacterized repeat protein (TIGR03837 family)